MFHPDYKNTRCTRMHYQLLSDQDKYLYREIYHALVAFREGIRLDNSSYFTNPVCWRIFKAVILDNPALFWVYFKLEYSEIQNGCELRFRYNMNSEKKDEYNRKIEQISSGLFDSRIKHCRSELKIEEIVHDYLASRVDYQMDMNYEHAHSLIGPLIYRKGVCEGISHAANYLLNCYGLRSTSIMGKTKNGGDHMWNVVIIDGHAYHLDVTFDLSDSRRISREFFNRDDEFMRGDREWSFQIKCDNS